MQLPNIIINIPNYQRWATIKSCAVFCAGVLLALLLAWGIHSSMLKELGHLNLYALRFPLLSIWLPSVMLWTFIFMLSQSRSMAVARPVYVAKVITTIENDPAILEYFRELYLAQNSVILEFQVEQILGVHKQRQAACVAAEAEGAANVRIKTCLEDWQA